VLNLQRSLLPTCIEEPRAELIHQERQTSACRVPPVAAAGPGSFISSTVRRAVQALPDVTGQDRLQGMCARQPQLSRPVRPPAGRVYHHGIPARSPNSIAAPEADTDREAMTGAGCAVVAAEALPTPLMAEYLLARCCWIAGLAGRAPLVLDAWRSAGTASRSPPGTRAGWGQPGVKGLGREAGGLPWRPGYGGRVRRSGDGGRFRRWRAGRRGWGLSIGRVRAAFGPSFGVALVIRTRRAGPGRALSPVPADAFLS
jgi:hypothetical protein